MRILFANQKHHTPHTHIPFDTLFGCSHFYLIIFKKKNTFSNLNAFFTCILMTMILHIYCLTSVWCQFNTIQSNIYVYCFRILLTISAFSVSFISFAHFILFFFLILFIFFFSRLNLHNLICFFFALNYKESFNLNKRKIISIINDAYSLNNNNFNNDFTWKLITKKKH